jgi:hypothetical protein
LFFVKLRAETALLGSEQRDTFFLVDCPHRWFAGFAEGGEDMNVFKILAVILIAAGIAGLLYGNFSFTRETHDIKLGPLEMSVAEKQTVNVPAWAGVAAIVAGGALLLYAGRKRRLYN